MRIFWWHQMGCVPLSRLHTGIKSWKIVHKIRGQRYFLKHATNDQSGKTFLLSSKKLSPRVVFPCPGAIYTCMKWNKVSYKIMRQKGSFWNWYKMMGIRKALKCSQNLYMFTKLFYAHALGLYTCLKLQKSAKSLSLTNVTRPLVLWVLFGFYSPSWLFHSFWANSIVRWGKNGKSPRKNTWPPGSRTWLVSSDPSKAPTHSGEMTSDLEC